MKTAWFGFSVALLLINFAGMPASPMPATTFESGDTQNSLIELFTSEGCSSCPPAEKWLSALKSSSDLWKKAVPVAFHVDYWDHLGWRDPFASKIWTERQADYSVRLKTESIYTPAFVLDGKEWQYGKLPEPSTETPGVLKITIDGERITAAFKPSPGSSGGYDIHVARLGFSLTADVTAGENTGKKLSHDFVV